MWNTVKRVDEHGLLSGPIPDMMALLMVARGRGKSTVATNVIWWASSDKKKGVWKLARWPSLVKRHNTSFLTGFWRLLEWASQLQWPTSCARNHPNRKSMHLQDGLSGWHLEYLIFIFLASLLHKIGVSTKKRDTHRGWHIIFSSSGKLGNTTLEFSRTACQCTGNVQRYGGSCAEVEIIFVIHYRNRATPRRVSGTQAIVWACLTLLFGHWHWCATPMPGMSCWATLAMIGSKASAAHRAMAIQFPSTL